MFEELMTEISEKAVLVDKMINQVMPEGEDLKVLYEASSHLIKAGGKRIRPFLVLKSCKLAGGSEDIALPTAAAIELLHTFTLVHDDVMDRSHIRRGVGTVHKVWDLPIAITAGDYLFAKVYEAIIRNTSSEAVSSDRLLQVLDTLTNATIEICEGQVLDLSYESKASITESECLNMIKKKTAALIEAAMRSGGIIGGASAREVEKLGSFGLKSGIAFQIIDDILGLTASEAILGKPVGDDLREGKKTLIIVHALEKGDDLQRKTVLSSLGNGKASDEQVRDAIRTLIDIGSIEYSRNQAKRLVDLAKEELGSFPNSDDKRILFSLADFFIARGF